jgi:phenylalanyl-tRNA synthetase alpha subunit
MASLAGSINTQQDLSSILSQVRGLEDEKAKLIQLLETERMRLKEVQAKTEKMSEAKRNEMRQALDTVIMTWLQDSVKDEAVREEFKQGMNRLVDNTAEDSGVWQVVCQASNVHAQRLQELERMRVENEELRTRGGGDFKDDASRKRGREETGESAGKDGGFNIWTEFEQEIRGGRTFGGGV